MAMNHLLRPRISRRERQAQLRDTAPGHASVLFVCTGNICRSAYAHHSLPSRLTGHAAQGTEVASQGTAPNQALTVPVELLQLAPPAVSAALAEHRPNSLKRAAVESADLVLAATADHMERVLHEAPQAMLRTFTLLEFAELVRRLDERTDEQWITPGMGVLPMARTAARHRALARGSGMALDLADPFRRPVEAYQAMVAQVDEALGPIADAVSRATAAPQTGGDLPAGD